MITQRPKQARRKSSKYSNCCSSTVRYSLAYGLLLIRDREVGNMYFKLLVFISIIATLGTPRVFAASSDSNSISTKLRLFDFGPTASMVRDSTGMNSLNAGARVGVRALNIQEDGVVASLVDASFVTQ